MVGLVKLDFIWRVMEVGEVSMMAMSPTLRFKRSTGVLPSVPLWSLAPRIAGPKRLAVGRGERKDDELGD